MLAILILGFGIAWFLGCIIYLIYFSNLFNPKKIRDSIQELINGLDKFKSEYLKYKTSNSDSSSLEALKKEIMDLQENARKLVNASEEISKNISRNKRAFTGQMEKLNEHVLDEVRKVCDQILILYDKFLLLLKNHSRIPEEMIKLIDSYLDTTQRTLVVILGMIPTVGGGGLSNTVKYAGIAISVIIAVAGNLYFFLK
jgi:hypothetical protein